MLMTNDAFDEIIALVFHNLLLLLLRPRDRHDQYHHVEIYCRLTRMWKSAENRRDGQWDKNIEMDTSIERIFCSLDNTSVGFDQAGLYKQIEALDFVRMAILSLRS